TVFFESETCNRGICCSGTCVACERIAAGYGCRYSFSFSCAQKSMLSAIIFDLDGVLADSETWWSQIDAKLLAEYGVTYQGEHHHNVVGVSYRLAVEFYKKAYGLSVPTEEMMRRRGEIATEFFANRFGLFPRVKEVLEELREMKLHLAV